MENFIVINKKIYEKYKDEILPLNARLFTEPYFYNLNEYKIPLDLKSLENYLSYVERISIFAQASFIDFVNILLVLSFLKEKQYKKEIDISYFIFNKSSLKDAMFCKTILTIDDLNDVDKILDCLKNNKQIKGLNLKVPGFINYINFYNMIIDKTSFELLIDEIMEEVEDDELDIASFLCQKYENMAINKDF